MQKYLAFKADPFRPLDYANDPRWVKEGNHYKLLHPDLEKDKQFLPVSFGVKVNAAEAKEDPTKKRVYIQGIANANIVDRVQERLDPRGIEVVDYLTNPQLLAHHSYYCPIGQVEELEIKDDGIHFSAWIGDPTRSELTQMQQEIRSLVLQNILKTVSVGFIPKKIRSAQYNDQGQLLEPAVIEQWELLEISVVAVPCNQASVFSLKDYPGVKELVKLTDKVSDLPENENAEGQQKAVVSTEKLAEDTVKPNQSEVDSTEGDGSVGQKEDNSDSNWKGEILTMLRALSENMQRNSDMMERLYQKMVEDDNAEGEEKPKPEDEEKPKPEDEEKEDDKEDKKSLHATVKLLAERQLAFEKDFEHLTNSVKLLVDHLGIGK